MKFSRQLIKILRKKKAIITYKKPNHEDWTDNLSEALQIHKDADNRPSNAAEILAEALEGIYK